MKRFLLLAALFAGSALAQEPCSPVDVSVDQRLPLRWAQTNTCVSGVPISECPVLGYIVERRTGTGAWEIVNGVTMLTAQTRTWREPAPLPAGDYYYRLQVVNAATFRLSPYSNEVCFRVPVTLRPGSTPPVLSIWTEQLSPQP